MRHKAQLRIKSCLRAVATAVLLVTGGAGAWRAAPKPTSASGTIPVAAPDRCDSVFVKSRVGWATREYKGALRQWDGDVPFPQTHIFLTLTELATRVQFEGPLDLAVLGDDPLDAELEVPVVGTIATFGAHGLYGFQYLADGRLAHARVLVSSLSDRLDSALVRAIRLTSDSGGLLPLPTTTKADSIEMRLTIGTSLHTDSLAMTAPLFRVRLPVFDQVTRVLAFKRHVAPSYPVSERQAGMEGTVDVAFVVRADGSVDPRSVLIQRATTMSFAQNVFDAVIKNTYTPAQVAGCRVPALTTQPYSFTIAR